MNVLEAGRALRIKNLVALKDRDVLTGNLFKQQVTLRYITFYGQKLPHSSVR